ncbi:diversity-generating retroelement protein Avd [Ectothiorhodospiraceae bacterium BW-2]|nr:diversity-generating retroelement protein Avd [Ectothiorhodospiraceae bacterium BW-2]
MRQKMAVSTPAAVELCHDLLKWIIPHLGKFPRNQRFTLAERIESGLLDVLEHLVEAAYSNRPATPLGKANLRLQRVKHLWRLSVELNITGQQQYAYAAELMEQLGRQIGGWYQSSAKTAK